MQRLDEAAIHQFGIPRVLLMEHAGMAVARAIQSLMPTPARSVLVCCGSGYNGGDGLCAAWHLTRWGYQSRMLLLAPLASLKEEPAIYAKMLLALDVPIAECESTEAVVRHDAWWQEAGVMVDALLGIGVRGAVRPVMAEVIARMNAAGCPIVAADIPSGLDGDTGRPQGAAVRATVTVTFGLPKHGLVVGEGPAYTGRLIVDDLGIPPHLLNAA